METSVAAAGFSKPGTTEGAQRGGALLGPVAGGGISWQEQPHPVVCAAGPKLVEKGKGEPGSRLSLTQTQISGERDE